jgi:hypothetical protein
MLILLGVFGLTFLLVGAAFRLIVVIAGLVLALLLGILGKLFFFWW